MDISRGLLSHPPPHYTDYCILRVAVGHGDTCLPAATNTVLFQHKENDADRIEASGEHSFLSCQQFQLDKAPTQEPPQGQGRAHVALKTAVGPLWVTRMEQITTQLPSWLRHSCLWLRLIPELPLHFCSVSKALWASQTTTLASTQPKQASRQRSSSIPRVLFATSR
ncbi:hypothetical protein NDU88_001764 [Pleurodeles waltl]|uniref:Uncharacterized protein n=1 Tax=Pleurodeles waltl TaxID=8319 RepID=A0AAV7VB56_PLEWA|nr:hypothetical protein NDU88_001764 [Pleurodeles waltl]